MLKIDQALLEAIIANNLEDVKNCLNEGANANIQESNGKTPLMLACMHGHNELVTILLAQPAIDININDGAPNYFTALYYAIDSKNTEIIDKLVARSDVSLQDRSRALIYFVQMGNLLKMKQILEEECDINYDNGVDTALTCAVKYNHIEIVKELLNQANIDINKTNFLNESPLIIAVNNNNYLIRDWLLDRKDINLHIQSYLYGTALTSAIFHKYQEAADKLLSKEERFDNNLHPGALIWCIRHNDIQFTELLIKKGADVNSTGEAGYQEPPDWVWSGTSFEKPIPFNRNPYKTLFELPIILAIQSNNEGMCRLLIESGALLDKEGTQHITAKKLITTLESDHKIRKVIAEEKENSPKSMVNTRSGFFVHHEKALKLKKIRDLLEQQKENIFLYDLMKLMLAEIEELEITVSRQDQEIMRLKAEAKPVLFERKGPKPIV